LRLGHRLDLLGKPGVGADTALFDFLNLAIDFVQRFTDRLDELFDGLLPVLEIALGLDLVLLERLLGEVEKDLVVALERLGRKRLESVGSGSIWIFASEVWYSACWQFALACGRMRGWLSFLRVYALLSDCSDTSTLASGSSRDLG
jgi:hypothetical protein